MKLPVTCLHVRKYQDMRRVDLFHTICIVEVFYYQLQNPTYNICIIKQICNAKPLLTVHVCHLRILYIPFPPIVEIPLNAKKPCNTNNNKWKAAILNSSNVNLPSCHRIYSWLIILFDKFKKVTKPHSSSKINKFK